MKKTSDPGPRPLALTCGEPAGIGPEVALRGVSEFPGRVELIGPLPLLRETASRLDLPWPPPERVTVRDIPLEAPVTPGRLDPRNAAHVLLGLSAAAKGAARGEYRGIVTAPVQKSVLSQFGRRFTGHTEFFAELAGARRVVMMLVSDDGPDALRVALATTHLPLSAVPSALTAELLDETIAILARDLRERFLGGRPARIAVTGLNPHAGEGGQLGDEEIRVIVPAIVKARAAGLEVSGPWPADAVFVPDRAARFDAILCMYHDQGLPTLKRVGFGHGVNVTLGLPWVRTSVDHGTALDIAGQGRAEHGSMLAALRLADRLARGGA